MSSKNAELMYGKHDEVCYYLDQTECTEGELRAALLNAFRRIEQLEKSVAAMKTNEHTHAAILGDKELDSWCPSA